jgi:hypothetical protein
MSLMIDFLIVEKEILYKMIFDILNLFDIVISEEKINFILEKEIIDKKYFVELIHHLISDRIENNVFSIEEVNRVINDIYAKYNESVINLLVSKFSIDIDNELSVQNIIWMLKSIKTNDLTILHSIEIIERNIREKKYDFSYSFYLDKIHKLLYSNIDNIKDSYLRLIPYYVLEKIVKKLITIQNKLIDNINVDLIDYSKNLISRPRINPLISGYHQLNDENIMPTNYSTIHLSYLPAYKYFNHSPNTGINLYSWALKPLEEYLSGSFNLSRIDNFTSVFDVHPSISGENPMEQITITSYWNIMRCLAGQIGLLW